MLSNIHKLEVDISAKINFLGSYLDFFPENVEIVSDEQSQGFMRI